ncbi:Vacuolar protein sorting-associated protein, partial [Thalictrum thalictroides]
MFEGIVENFLLSYIGSYVKNIQKEQLKVQWNGRVLLKNVELNLEAFDKLQLPFSLKEGRVGILSIKVGHPIIISLENVLICACERDDHEWSSDSVERREYAGKKAKLHAAEVAKFTRRVS